MTDAADINLGLKDRVVLVTGGVRGVGAGISAVFADQGATVVTCARRAVEGLPYEFHSCDVRDDDAVAALIGTIVERHGRLDVVINNAGGSPYVLTADASAKFNRKIIELNLLGPLSVSQHANAVMQAQDKGGSIVNIASVSAHLPLSRVFAYSASKAAVVNLTQNVARELAPLGVRVNALCPGFFPAEQNRKILDPARVEKIMAQTPMGRFGEPHELVGATLLMLSRKAGSFITGAAYYVDGGFTAMRL